MQTVTVNLYEFDELSDKSKECAREWWRKCESQDFGAHGELYEPIETAAKLLGITFRTHAVRLMSGKDRYEPDVWWQLDGQGYGASFSGDYAHAKRTVDKVNQEFPTDAKLNAIAIGLAALQRKYRYRITAKIDAAGRMVHKYGMWVEVLEPNDRPETLDESMAELMRDFADWIFDCIRTEYEYRMSDENVDESIRANEYTFRADGKRSDGTCHV